MAPTPGELVRIVAEALDEAEPTVIQHDRNLFAAGLRTKGGRGPSAAKTTLRDAAHLTIAVMGTQFVRDSVEVVKGFGATKVWKESQNDRGWAGYCVPELARLPDEHTLIDAVEALFLSIGTGSLHEALRRACGPGGAPNLPDVRLAVQMPMRLGDLSIGPGPASRCVRYERPPDAIPVAERGKALLGLGAAFYSQDSRKIWQQVGLQPMLKIANAFFDSLPANVKLEAA